MPEDNPARKSFEAGANKTVRRPRVWAEGSMKTCAAAGSIEALDHACRTTWYSAQKVQYRQLMEPRNCRVESTSLWVWPEPHTGVLRQPQRFIEMRGVEHVPEVG